jgi:hypothetical protein
MSSSAARPLLRPSLVPLALLLAAGATGCFRATGLQRSVLVAEEIPAVGGDRPAGLKAAAGPGDYYLGNDYIELAMDGTPFGERDAIAGAASGGSIVDIGFIQLDTSYRRVSMPSDSLDRLTPVVNQDPDLQLVFDRYEPRVESDTAILEATGGLYDPKHKLAGAAWDSRDRVVGLTATHRVKLDRLGRFFTLSTTVTNASQGTLPVRSIGDALIQRGGGYRAVVPAQKDANGAPVSTWGIQIPGSDFSQPLASSVQAPMVGFMAAEPAGLTEDCHASLGLLPLDADQFFVASDPQDALHENRPSFPARVVVGGLPGGGLAQGQSLTHNRRLYIIGGRSLDSSLPAQTTRVMNDMQLARASLRASDVGTLYFRTFGSSVRGGALQAELRLERNLGTATSPLWQLERVEWWEPNENQPPLLSGFGSLGDTLATLLPTGTYRIVARNRLQSSVLSEGINISETNTTRPNLVTDLKVDKDQVFFLNLPISPERSQFLAQDGSFTGAAFTNHTFTVRGQDSTDTRFQPLRITLAGVGGTEDPSLQRARGLGSIFDQVSKQKLVASSNGGSYRFRGGNTVFGASFLGSSPEFTFLRPGNYLALGTRGPLGPLDTLPIQAYDGQQNVYHSFLVFPASIPAGWTSFDLPGPTQATTGGLLPSELMASALAEKVSVVARTEQDLHTDPDQLHKDFHFEFVTTDEADRSTIGEEPFVVPARSSDLGGYGFVTALFAPKVVSGVRGGAQSPRGWTLADFLTQGQGGFNVVHRPRGPKGLFTQKGFNPAVALGTGVNAWWNAQGAVSLGRTQGSFEALELLRAESFDPANPGAWFAEFKQVRSDWFALLNQQTPAGFTKALGLSGSRFSLDTPVGLARTYLKTGSSTLKQDDLSSVLAALKAGAAVASTGPLLDVSVGSTGPGGLVTGSNASVTLSITLTAGDWVPVEQLRVVVNGQVVQAVPVASALSQNDSRTRSGSLTVNLPAGKDAWIVVEAGVPLATTGAYAAGTAWAKVSRGIYPIAVTNPIFVDVNGGGYVPPGL